MELVDDLPVPTDEDRRRGALICRLAAVLEEMAETADPRLPEALGWRNRADLERLLDGWEAGRHGAPAGG
jgi:hypothetical protein